jgi:tetratricopeptide (TPR) repeat protein
MTQTPPGQPDPFHVLSDAFNRRDWSRACELARTLLEQQPGHPLLHYVAGASSLELQQLPRALAHLQQAATLAPDRVDFAILYAKALSIAKLREPALEAAKKARRLAWDNPAALDALGVVYTQAGQHDQAMDVFRRLIELAPGQAHHHFNYAAALVIAGDIAQAEAEFETCLTLDPTYWRAHLSLTQVRRQTPEHNHVERLEKLLPTAGQDPMALANLHLALAKELEDLKRYPQAIDHLKQGKAFAVSGRHYDFADDEALFAAIEHAFPVSSVAPAGCPSRKPIFVIGMPRSGTTLVERILSSHPDVHSAGELLDFGLVLKRASGSRTPSLIDADTVTRASTLDGSQLGQAYLASTGARAAEGGKPRFVDKLPHNFLYAGFIARALPEASIVCLRRHPMDTCLSNFRQFFGVNAPFFGYSFNLGHTARYYALFDHLMAHWRQVLPGRILEVRYEDIIADQEQATRELLAHCGLGWDDACLAFENNTAPVATASAVQVRSPIYRNAHGRWKAYGDTLDEVRQVLQDAGIAIGD